ncbi:histidinol-phosphatase [Actinomycetaceae bacterium L2_0104]
MTFSLSDDLLLALDIADRVDALTMERFRADDLVVETKPDLTPVSDADKNAEQIVRNLLTQHRPDDEIYGEEQGGSLEHSARRWILDPIDGTKNFVRGVPVWATLLALESGGEVVLGVVSAPALGRRWWAAQGMGAFLRTGQNPPEALRVSAVSAIEDASLSYSSLSGWQERGQAESFYQLATACWRSRAYGDFWSYMMVAEGTVDIAAEPELEIYDMAALVPIVIEAGGTFTSLEGEPGPWGTSAIASNALLHEGARAILGSGAVR